MCPRHTHHLHDVLSSATSCISPLPSGLLLIFVNSFKGRSPYSLRRLPQALQGVYLLTLCLPITQGFVGSCDIFTVNRQVFRESGLRIGSSCPVTSGLAVGRSGNKDEGRRRGEMGGSGDQEKIGHTIPGLREQPGSSKELKVCPQGPYPWAIDSAELTAAPAGFLPSLFTC